MKTVTLNNGVKMPILGFGVFQVTDLKECEQSVSDALSVGYRLIDTASAYHNEEAVGKAIKNSGIPRDEIFLTSKLWISDTGYESTKKAFQTSLDKLGLDYLDLYLIHQPFGDYYGSWRAMEELYKEEKIRAIGVSNFFPDRLTDLILHNEIVPAVNQIETHPFYQRADYQEYMNTKGVQIESWGPFAEGKNNIFTNDVLQSIAKKHNRSVAQIVLHWLIQRDVVVIPKSTHRNRIEENFNIFDFELSNDEMLQISQLDEGKSLFLDHHDVNTVEYLSSLK